MALLLLLLLHFGRAIQPILLYAAIMPRYTAGIRHKQWGGGSGVALAPGSRGVWERERGVWDRVLLDLRLGRVR